MTDALLTLRRSLERGGALLMSDQHRVRLERWVRGGLEARRLRQADAAVVSFGKAGRTWLRVMLSHFYRARYGIDEPILFEFDNLHRLNRAIPKLFFTHDNYLGDWTGQGRSKADYFERPVLFLARHPADTAVSQYHQWAHRMRPHKKLLNQYPSHGETLSLFEFVMGEGGGIPRIVRFMNDWAEAFPKTLRHQVVRYEDLRAETTATLASLLTFLGAPNDPEAVQAAVDFASFERMKAREATGERMAGAGDRLTAADPNNPDSFKTRRAKVAGYRDDFTAQELAEIDQYIDTHLHPRFAYGRGQENG